MIIVCYTSPILHTHGFGVMVLNPWFWSNGFRPMVFSYSKLKYTKLLYVRPNKIK